MKDVQSFCRLSAFRDKGGHNIKMNFRERGLISVLWLSTRQASITPGTMASVKKWIVESVLNPSQKIFVASSNYSNSI